MGRVALLTRTRFRRVQPFNSDFDFDFTLSTIVQATATQLLFPFVCAGVGGALGYTLPRAWTARTGRPTSILQERWGRSVVGGAVFVVARDAINLLTKYRFAKNMKQRKVLNAKKKKKGPRANAVQT